MRGIDYHVTVNRDLKNMEGVAMREEFQGWFTADIPEISVERIQVQNADNLGVYYLDLAAGQFNTYTPYACEILPGEDPDYFTIQFSALFDPDADDFYTIADHVTLTKVFPVTGVEYEKRNVLYAGGTLTVAFQDVPDEKGAVFRLLIAGGPDGLVDQKGAYLEKDVCVYFKIEVIP